MKNNLFELTIKEAAELLKSQKISALELVESCIGRIRDQDKTINAFITVIEDEALGEAKKIDERRKSGEKLSDLAGIPFSMKDVYLTKGIRTTAGSKILSDYIGHYDATVYKKLKESGAILIGKTNCDPFGFGSSTEHSAYGMTKNPRDVTRVPGGSSGGSGAAVAYGGGLFSIAEDTGGSIRCPASFCGVVGLKPTYGRVSRYGAIAYASSYDCVGPITKTVEDMAIVMECIAGNDENDATSSNLEVPSYTDQINDEIKGMRIGIPEEYFGEGLDPEVKENVLKAVEKYKELGCIVKNISLPYTQYAIAAYYVIALSEASSNLARYDGIRYSVRSEGNNYKEIINNTRGENFSPEEKRRIMIGTYALSAGYADQYYKKAQKVRQIFKQDFKRAFEEVDFIITPTMPVLPFKIGENTDDPLKMWLVDAFTVSLNPVGLPGISIPVENSKEGLPIGMQIIAPHFAEDKLLNFANKYIK